jgi:predicted membrane channel-forming protein YqfA (hemolysin III family)
MRPTITPPQWLASFLLLVAATTHIPLIKEHLDEAPYIGVLFILLSVVCIVLAVVILVVDNPGVWLISGAVCLAAVVAFLASRTVGLPQIGDDVGNWTEPLGLPAVASEALMALLAWVHLRRPRTTTAGRSREASQL